jgi:hypothetical protein
MRCLAVMPLRFAAGHPQQRGSTSSRPDFISAPRQDALSNSPESELRPAMHRERELDSIQQTYEETDDVAEETDRHCEEIEVALKQFDDWPLAYEAADTAYAGAFISIGRRHGMDRSRLRSSTGRTAYRAGSDLRSECRL